MKSITSSIKNKLTFLVIIMALGINYGSTGIVPHLTVTLLSLFFVPLIGFPKILLLDFYGRVFALITSITLFNSFFTTSVFNPVTKQWKLSLGFSNPNMLGMQALILIIELVLLYKHFNKKIAFAIYFTLVISLLLSHSRASIWSLLLFIGLYTIFTYKKDINKFNTSIALLPVAFLLISVFLMLYVSKNTNLNLFSSSRLGLSHYYFHNYSIPFIGKNILEIDKAFDMGHLSSFYANGFLLKLIFYIFFVFTLLKLGRLGYWKYNVALITMLFHGTFEAVFYVVKYNPFLLVFGVLLSQFDYLKPNFNTAFLPLTTNWLTNRVVKIKANPLCSIHSYKKSKLVTGWVIVLGILLIPIYPTVNQIIYGYHLKPVSVTRLKSTFTEDFPYRKNHPEGIVVHETADRNQSARQEAFSFLKTWKKREAYVHAFVDSTSIYQIHPTNRAVWGAGKPANERFIQVELCEEYANLPFAKSILNDATYIADLLHYYHLKPSLTTKKHQGTIWSHNQVSKYLGNTDHTDPTGYFAQHNYSMKQFFQLISLIYYQKTLKVNPFVIYFSIVQKIIFFMSLGVLLVLRLWQINKLKEGLK